MPNPTAKNAQQSNRLKKEVVRLKLELNATSAQDEFSKWAKLRRQHDKATAEYEKSGMFGLQDEGATEQCLTNMQHPPSKQQDPTSTASPMAYAGSQPPVSDTFYNSGTRNRLCFGCRRDGCQVTSNGCLLSHAHPPEASAYKFGASHV